MSRDMAAELAAWGDVPGQLGMIPLDTDAPGAIRSAVPQAQLFDPQCCPTDSPDRVIDDTPSVR